MRSHLKSYLSISKKEWNGLVILVILIALVLAAPYVYQLYHKDNVLNLKEFNQVVATIEKARLAQKDDGITTGSISAADIKLFRFNPNKLPPQKWRALGLTGQQIAVITHYEEKGGYFYTKDDLKKIYSITQADYMRLEPYIYLNSNESASKLKPNETIELNSADSAHLTRLRGIGPSFAIRIIHYRERLGGFHHKDQLKEVFGLDDDKYDEIKNQLWVNQHAVKKISINKVNFESLSHFPYLSFKQINAIVQYRDQHGDYESIADMHNIAILDNKLLQKIKPYLKFK